MTIEDKVNVAISTAKIYKQIWEDIVFDVFNQLVDTKIIYSSCNHPEINEGEVHWIENGNISAGTNHYIQCKKCGAYSQNYDFSRRKIKGKDYYFRRSELEFLSKAVDSVMAEANSIVRNKI